MAGARAALWRKRQVPRMGEQSAVAQRAAFARRAARMLAAHVAEPPPAVARAAVRRPAAQRAERLPVAQVPHAERVQREAPRAVRALQERGARPALLRLRHRPYAVARRLSSPLPQKR